ncbi:hypothetical protein TNCT_287851 [Trichonephila clavata]|uniref:Uncharacterized protein n=1 Tax=Trichonephila clavata TaxID=2740835 RepID=A0A8X6L7J8_TRICU|nr:hypothetical protein TNCT_287851 [Trichonephila clavata]
MAALFRVKMDGVLTSFEVILKLQEIELATEPGKTMTDVLQVNLRLIEYLGNVYDPTENNHLQKESL